MKTETRFGAFTAAGSPGAWNSQRSTRAGTPVSCRLGLSLAAEHRLRAGLIVIGHSWQMVDPFAPPRVITLDPTSTTRLLRRHGPCGCAGASGTCIGPATALLPVDTRQFKCARPYPALGCLRLFFHCHVFGRIFPVGNGVAALDHEAVDVHASLIATGECPAVLVGAYRVAAEFTPSHQPSQLISRLLTTSPSVAFTGARLIDLRSVDAVQPDTAPADSKGIAIAGERQAIDGLRHCATGQHKKSEKEMHRRSSGPKFLAKAESSASAWFA
jgi:hypothetical protein